jgi:hypothetical protein
MGWVLDAATTCCTGFDSGSCKASFEHVCCAPAVVYDCVGRQYQVCCVVVVRELGLLGPGLFAVVCLLTFDLCGWVLEGPSLVFSSACPGACLTH